MNGSHYWPFPPTSASFYCPSEPQFSQPGGSQPVLDINQFANTVPQCMQSPIPLATSTPSPQSPAMSDSDVLAAGNKKGKKIVLNPLTGPKEKPRMFQKLGDQDTVSCEELLSERKIKIWNEIYSSYKESHPESQRTLQQAKKHQQNLEYKYKPLKQQSR